MKESHSHRKLKEKARQWLEGMGYSVQEEVNIGNRRVDILGTRPDSPKDMIGVECGEITNETPPPEDIVIFHLPYGGSEPYRWEPPASPKSSILSRIERTASTMFENALRREYQIRVPVEGRKSFTVTMPYEVVEREARRRNLSLEEFLEKYKAVAHFDDFEGVFYSFESKQ